MGAPLLPAAAGPARRSSRNDAAGQSKLGGPAPLTFRNTIFAPGRAPDDQALLLSRRLILTPPPLSIMQHSSCRRGGRTRSNPPLLVPPPLRLGQGDGGQVRAAVRPYLCSRRTFTRTSRACTGVGTCRRNGATPSHHAFVSPFPRSPGETRVCVLTAPYTLHVGAMRKRTRSAASSHRIAP